MVWILCSEIQPLKCRDFGITCSTTTNWVSNMIIGATFLTLLDSTGAAGTFWLYTALNIAFVGITFWLIPETKNVTLEHIERKLMAGEKLRNIGVRFSRAGCAVHPALLCIRKPQLGWGSGKLSALSQLFKPLLIC